MGQVEVSRPQRENMRKEGKYAELTIRSYGVVAGQAKDLAIDANIAT